MKKLHISLPNLKQEKGQSLIILAFSFVGLIALMGLGLDMGLVYIERSALKRAIDAAVLSGVTELSNEQEAGDRALSYLDLNGYDISLDGPAEIYFKGCFRTPGETVVTNKEQYTLYKPYLGEGEPEYTFWVNTLAYQEGTGTQVCGDHDNNNSTPPLLGNANKLAITGTVNVNMNFFRLLGRPSVPVTDHAIAQNIDNLDIVFVLDRSGSMEFDPVCYGCWTRHANITPNPNPSPPFSNIRYANWWEYPINGSIYPLQWDKVDPSINGNEVCLHPGDEPKYKPAETAYAKGSYRYLVMEAEMYSLNSTVIEPGLQAQGKGYWALQRGEANYGYGDNNNTLDYGTNNAPWIVSTGTTLDSYSYIVGEGSNDNLGTNLGAHMAHHPSIEENDGVPIGKYYDINDAKSGNIPYLAYNFRLEDAAGWGPSGVNTAYIWVRVHGGRGMRFSNALWASAPTNHAYWGLIEADSNAYGAIPDKAYPDSSSLQEMVATNPNVNQGANWYWLRLGGFTVQTNRDYRFYFAAGSPGYSIDRIIITTNPSSNGNNGDGSSLNYNGTDFRTIAPNMGSADKAACDVCNEMYGKNISASGGDYPTVDDCEFYKAEYTEPTNNALSPLFSEWESPLRGTKEGIKTFARNLDPERDQIGLVTYNSSSSLKEAQLTCLKAAQTQGIDCVTGTSPYSFTNVLSAVEGVRANNGTPTARGMVDGLEVLGLHGADLSCDGSTNSSCARNGSQKVLILMTDGVPNTNGYEDGCTSSNAPQWSINNAPYRCPLYWAQEAASNGVIVYAVGIGFGVDNEWLAEIARLGNGLHFTAADEGNLNVILSTILENIYVKLVE